MIQYDSFQFATPPNTGAVWFVKAAQVAGMGPGFAHYAYAPFPIANDSKRLRVSLVRHPCDWLACLYKTVVYDGLRSNHIGPFHFLDYSNFDAFVRSYLSRCPGGVGEIYNKYEADTCLRIEDMPAAFVELLESLGVDERLRENCRLTPQKTTPINWKPELKRLVREAEQEICDAYDYY